jgi:putative flippase GtrA
MRLPTIAYREPRPVAVALMTPPSFEPSAFASSRSVDARAVEAPAKNGLPVALELLRYFLASAGALAVDTGLFSALLQAGMAYPVAATLGFCAGAVVAYLASVFWVFESRSVRNAGVEFGVFVGIGVGGLLLTEALLWLFIGRLGLPPVASKLGAAGFVFLFNFVVRRATLFRSRAA